MSEPPAPPDVRRRRRLRHPVRPRRGGPGRATAPSSAAAVHDVPARRHRPTRCPDGDARCRRTGRCRCPADYVDVLRTRRARGASRAAGIDPADVIGIGTDFTACTVVPIARRRHAAVRAAASSRDRPHAYVKLWKHHAAQPQADRINAARRTSAASRGCRATAG